MTRRSLLRSLVALPFAALALAKEEAMDPWYAKRYTINIHYRVVPEDGNRLLEEIGIVQLPGQNFEWKPEEK